MTERFRPVAGNSERIVLGLALVDETAAQAVAELPVDIFGTRKHQVIHQAIVEAWGRHATVNVQTVIESLQRTGRFASDKTGSGISHDDLFELDENLPPSAQMKGHRRILAAAARQRRLLESAEKIAGKAGERFLDDTELSQLEADFQAAAFSSVQEQAADRGPVDLQTVVSSAFQEISEKYEGKRSSVGLTSGVKALDAATNGFHGSELIIVSARPGCGKTSFVLKIALAAAQRVPVYLASLEMSAQQIGERFFAMTGNVDLRHVRSGQLQPHQWQSLTDALGRLSDYPIYVDDRSNLSPAMLKSRVQRLAVDTKRPMGLLLVDYLQLMAPGQRFDTREREVATISRDLKLLAKTLDVPVIVACQLNRQLEQRKDRRPMLADLRESGALEQDADLVLGLYLPFNYTGEDEDRDKAECIIMKQRNGPVGTLGLHWNPETTTFFDAHP